MFSGLFDLINWCIEDPEKNKDACREASRLLAIMRELQEGRFIKPLTFSIDGPTREIREKLLNDVNMLTRISESIYTMKGESFKDLFPRGTTCALVPYAFQEPKSIFDLSDWFNMKGPMVAILEPYLMDAVNRLLINKQL